MIRLRSKSAEQLPGEVREGPNAGLSGSGISHRRFLKLLVTGVGAAGLAQLAVPPQKALASYVPGTPDWVNTSLTVQGNLLIGGEQSAVAGRQLELRHSTNDDSNRIRLNSTAVGSYRSGLEFFNGATFKGGLFRRHSDDLLGIWTLAGETMALSSNGKVGIAKGVPLAKLDINGASATSLSTGLIARDGYLGSTAGSYVYPAEIQTDGVHLLRLQFAGYRTAATGSWLGTAFRIQYAVDSSFADGSKAFYELGGGSDAYGYLALGTDGVVRVTIDRYGIKCGGRQIADGGGCYYA